MFVIQFSTFLIFDSLRILLDDIKSLLRESNIGGNSSIFLNLFFEREIEDNSLNSTLMTFYEVSLSKVCFSAISFFYITKELREVNFC